MGIFSSFEELNNEGDSNGAIVLRDEQKEAISRAKKHFEGKSDYLKFLWNAKMRFGKTICAMHLARDMGVKTCLIVTHRPVVNQGWKEDFQKTFGKDNAKYQYGTLFKDKDNNHTQNEGNYYELERFAKQEGNHLVFFVSMQYLCLSPEVNTNTRNRSADNGNNKLKAAILNKEWDLVVIDEAHEGTRTALGKRVIDMLSKPKTKVLHLSGTPFNLYQDFNDGEIYTWDYIKEQRAKAECEGEEWKLKNPGKQNPYAGLPRMKIFTYDLASLLDKYRDEEQVFSFKEFFRTWIEKRDKGHIPEGKTGKFVHEDDVNQFLDLLCEKSDNTGYPFSTDEYRNNFKHTLWVVPGVSEAKALKELLEQHKIFKLFSVINVAGNNEEDETRSNALDSVTNTIGADPNSRFTITISCGRLTTGVTVPPWTAVLYLKGSENTAASTYMQTIFRVQSPWDYSSGGKRYMKSECYVFDFAPSRTLKMMAETAKFSVDTEDIEEKKKKKDKSKRPSTQDDKDKMRELLNYCPVVSLSGGQMREYNTDELFAQLDRVYIDRVVRNGFNDNSLYNVQALLQLDPEALNRLGELISKTSNLEKPKKAGTVDMTGSNPKNKPKTSNGAGDDTGTSPEDDAQKQEERERKRKEREERDNRITILRGISLRIPLLIYGAELSDETVGITIDNFTAMVDDASWAEFMPRGVTKEDFNAFKVAYNPTVFVESGKRIRALAREADDMPTEFRIQRIAEIFSYFHNPDKETVLTPWRVVNMHMSDCIGGFCFYNEKFDGPNQKEIVDEATGELKIVDTHEPRLVISEDVTENIFAEHDPETLNLTSKILEINSKTGLYPLYVTYSLFRFRCAHFVKANLIKNPDSLSIEEEHVIWDDIVKNNIYVICNTPMAKAITKRTLLGFRKTTFEPKIKSEKLVEQAQSNRAELVAKIKDEGYWNSDKMNNKAMKFNAVVGNPPYQENISSSSDNSSLSKQIFPIFIEICVNIKPDYFSIITPSRWFAGDAQDKSFLKLRQFLMKNNKIKKLVNFPISRTVFSGVEISGGVNYFLYDDQYYGKVEFTEYYNESENTTISRPLFEEGLDIVLSSGKNYKIIQKVLNQDFVSMVNITQGRNAFGVVGKNVESISTKERVDDFQFELRCKYEEVRFINKNLISKNLSIAENWKIFISKGNGGAGLLTDDRPVFILGKPFIGKPNSACTDSLIPIGSFNSEIEAKSLLNYIKTKFFRYMVGLLKVSQNVYQNVYQFVPLQNFTENSDIDWNKPIPEIDKRLYLKYGLTADEIGFIESKIKPME
jgi:hypothetical protein